MTVAAPMSDSSRKKRRTWTKHTLEREANDILREHPEKEPVTKRVRYRGGRPAMTWLAKQDPAGAASLWLFARRQLPQAANDNLPLATGMAIERRKDGKPRGANEKPQDLGGYLSIPAVVPRFGEPPGVPIAPRGWFAWVPIKPQAVDAPLHPDCRFGFCAPAVAAGASFLGADSGLGRLKPGKSRGDIRRVDEPELPTRPPEVAIVVEEILAGGNIADVGRALGARGGHADRRGGRALLEAASWAKTQLTAQRGAKSRPVAP